MARRSDDDRKQMRKPDRGDQNRDQEKKKEQEEAVEKEGLEPEHARLQNQLGNQGVTSLIANQTATASRGGTSTEVQIAKRPPAHEKDGQDYGGEAEGGDPLTPKDLDFLVDWNPGTTQPSERPLFVEAMPDEVLPPENPELEEAFSRVPPGFARDSVDALLQPPLEAIVRGPRGWLQGSARFVGVAAHERAWAHVWLHPPSLLQDPHGRVLFGRTRAVALACCALPNAPFLASHPGPESAHLVARLLALEAQNWRIASARAAVPDIKARPISANLFALLAPEALEPPDDGVDKAAPERAVEAARLVLTGIARLDDPFSVLASLFVPEAPPADPDDPLGIDDVLTDFTGGPRDLAETAHRMATQTAERLAATVFMSRIRLAGAGAAIAYAAPSTPQSTRSALCDALRAFDAASEKAMQKLRDTARHAQRRTLPVARIERSLRDAASSIAESAADALVELARPLCWGLDPNVPLWEPPSPPPPDPLATALADGEPRAALPWALEQPPSLHREATIAFLRLASGLDADEVGDSLARLRSAALDWGHERLAFAAGIGLGACLLRQQKWQSAKALADAQWTVALDWRNGVCAADAALVGVEARRLIGDDEGALLFRREKALALWNAGATTGASLVSRWQPPEDEGFGLDHRFGHLSEAT